jgi:hypothetical protein
MAGTASRLAISIFASADSADQSRRITMLDDMKQGGV